MTRLLLIVIPLLALSGCKKAADRELAIYRMGDRVQVGSLIYNVLEADWKSQIGDGPSARLPKNRFLILRVTVTNSGGRQASIPSFTIEDDRGRTFGEETNGEGVTQWLGIIRRVDPAQTEDGRIMFDAPPANYKLRVSDESDLTQTQEKFSLIRIPLNLEGGAVPEVPAR